MAQKNNDSRRVADDGSRSLGAHPQPGRIEAHPEPGRLPAHDAADDVVVPAVTADVDETPGFVKYGAAVLLGLAVGVGGYVWYSGGVPSAPANPGGHMAKAATYEYFNTPTAYYQADADGTVPDPFSSPFEVTGYTAEPEIVNAGMAMASYGGETTAYGQTNAGAGNAESQAGLTNASASDASTAAPAAAPVTVVYLFQYDSSDVPETASLTQIAEQATRSGVTLDVKAYTDEHGRPAYNQRLSERRAKAVADYLVEHGVPSSKIRVKGMGATDRFANDAQDRRAEVSLRQ